MINRVIEKALFGSFSNKQSGGGKGMNHFTLFVVAILFFFLKAYLVMFSYNYVVPRMYPEQNTKLLNFTEAIFLTILVNNLVH